MSQSSADMAKIARCTGVSVATVHRALMGTGRVSAETRRRVLDAARSMDYRPNRVAQSLRTQRTGTIGMVVMGLSGSLYSHILDGVESICRQSGHSVLISCSNGHPERERDLVEVLLQKRVDGLIVAPCDPEENADYYRHLLSLNVQLVFIDRFVPGLDIDVVCTDNARGGYMATRHLLSLGRRRVVFVTVASRENRATSVQSRLEGCNRALLEADLPLARVVGPNTADVSPQQLFALNAMQDFLQHGGELDAVFAVNDDIALGVIDALETSGRRVPEDVSVVGFDDQDISAYCRPSLTTIRQPMRHIGEEAAHLLLRRVAAPDASSPRQTVMLEPSLVVRQSCGCATG